MGIKNPQLSRLTFNFRSIPAITNNSKPACFCAIGCAAKPPNRKSRLCSNRLLLNLAAFTI